MNLKITGLAALLAVGTLYGQELPKSPTPTSSPGAQVGEAPSSIATPPATPIQGPVTLQEIHVFAPRLGVAQKELSGDEIQEARDRGDLSVELDRQPGLETQGEGMGKAWSTLAIRGQSFRETLVLVNGVRVPECFNLATIPTEDIQDVEVLEGVPALAYGSDALGGVLNIITRKPEDGAPLDLQATGGDFNTYQFQGSLPSFDLAGAKNRLSASWFTTDGYLPAVTDPSTGVTYGFTDEVHWDVSHQAQWNMGGGLASLSSSFFRHTGSAPDEDNVIAAGTDQYDLDGRQDAWGVESVFQDVQPLGGGWQFLPVINGNYSSVIRSNPIGADPTSGVYLPYLNQYLDYGAQAFLSGSAGPSWPQLSFGLEGRDESLWSGLYGDYSRYEETLSASSTWKWTDSLRLELANNLDHYSDYGIIDCPSGSLVWDAEKGWQVRLGAGEGYKIPTYDQLYLPYTSFAALPPELLQQFSQSPFAAVWAGDKGNPGLRPEQALDTELETDIQSGGWLLQLAGFLDYYQNLINAAVDPTDNFWTYININQAFFAGTENSLTLNPQGTWSPRVSATWISATDQNGNPIQGRMHFKFTAGLDLKPEKEWSLGLDARYVESNPVAVQYLTDLGFPAPPTAYWNLDARIQYHVSEHLKGFFGVENLLNSQIASFQGIPLPGRYLEGGLEGVF